MKGKSIELLNKAMADELLKKWFVDKVRLLSRHSGQAVKFVRKNSHPDAPGLLYFMTSRAPNSNFLVYALSLSTNSNLHYS